LCGEIEGRGSSTTKQIAPQSGTIPALGLRAGAMSVSSTPAARRWLIAHDEQTGLSVTITPHLLDSGVVRLARGGGRAEAG
jgi:hypothetical protein